MLQYCSNEPRLPLWQGGPSGLMPIKPGSGAAPLRPVNSSPPNNTPPPTPVPRVSNNTSDACWAAPSQCSPTRAQLASLAVVTRRSSLGSSQSARGTSSQPGRLMATRAIRPQRSLGPGWPMPTRVASRSGSNASTASAIAMVTPPGIAGWGVGISKAWSREPSQRNRPSLIAVPPISTPISWSCSIGSLV